MGTERNTALALMLKELKCLPSKSFCTDFNERLKLQKTVYLLQTALDYQMMAGLGYVFSWYLRGPYSSAVADDLYALATDLQELPTGVNLTPKAKKTVSTVGVLLRPPTNSGMNDVSWLELLASLHYLSERCQPKGDFTAAWRELQISKPNLASISQAREAWKTLEIQNLIGGPEREAH